MSAGEAVGAEIVVRRGGQDRNRWHPFLRQRLAVALALALATLGASVTWSRAAVAQEATNPQPTAVAPADPAQMAPAEPTPEHIAKARQLILATGISRSFQIIVPEFMDQIGNTLTQARPDLVHDMNQVLDTLKPEFDRQSEEMIDQSARIYATLLSEKDIDTINTFFASEPGRHYVGAQPFFLNQLVSGMQAWQQKISINMMTRVRQEMKKKGHDL